MANHMSTTVVFNQISTAGLVEWNKLMKRFEQDENSWHPHEAPLALVFGLGLDEEDGPGSYRWNLDHMGAKWANVYDVDDSGFQIESAWSVPDYALDWIFSEIYNVDSTFVAGYTFIDEFGSPLGWQTWRHGEWEDSNQYDWEDVLDRLLDEHQDLREEYDIEKQEFTEEGNDLLYEYQYDIIEDMTWLELNDQFNIYKNE